MPQDESPASLQAPPHLLPLVRQLSYWLTRLLYPLPVTPNQITALSLACGLAAGLCYASGGWRWDIIGAVFFVADYVLDNSDGEIARLKGLQSDFGMWFDSFVDWAIHAALFIGLGVGVAGESGNNIWLWMGLIAAFGGTVNAVIDGYLEWRDKTTQHAPPKTMRETTTTGRMERLVLVARVIRTDFCFVLLALSLFDAAWVLLPATAVGAQAYWMLHFVKGARSYHV
jgi:phosphatidylglycerophosphate synthase